MFEDLFSRVNKSKVDLTKLITKNAPFSIHVAGTNGKGSTCSYLEAVLSTKYKVGKFTSPHLISPYERITINGKYISEEDFSFYYNKYKDLELGFFEFCFLIAMKYFEREKVDIAIIEVGIGGRLDTTNILNYDIALITNVGYDHTELLGETLEKIAFEKAGVAKNNTKCFYTDIRLKEFVEKNTNDSKFLEKNTKFNLPLKGEFQQKNFALAYEVFKFLNFTDKEIEQGLNNFKILGRQQMISKNIMIDVSHNEDSIKVLLENIRGIPNIQIFMSCLIDKDIEKIYNLLSKDHDVFIVPMPNTKRGRTKENILSFLPNANIAENIHIDKNKFTIFCGSFYFISDVLKKHILY